MKVGVARVDEKGRVLIPFEDRVRIGLRPGVEVSIKPERDGLLLKPLVPAPVRVRAKRRAWGKETFPDAGEATFGE